MKYFLIFFLIAATFVMTAGAQSYTPELFKQFVEMRVGAGEPVYWYCVGEIYSYPDGKLIANVEGIDTARLMKSASSAAKSVQLSRKIFFYRDALTNEVLREANGKKVERIAYPYQHITYEYRDKKLLASVVQGKAPRIQNVASTGQNFVRQFGGATVFSLPLFLNFPSYQAYENYDFFRYPKAAKGVPQFQLSWNRRGPLPPFFGGGDSVFQLASYRVDKYADLPQTLRETLEKDARLWMNPPKDLKEIEELQKP